MRSPVLTVHAWERWCERVRPIAYQDLHDYLMTPGLCAAIAAGVQSVRLYRDGVSLQIRRGSITTVVPLGDKSWKRRKRRAVA
jgi:hypothetical protein